MTPPNDDARRAAIARRLADDWRDRAPYATLTGDLAPVDIADAYAAQSALQALLAASRGPRAGRKIALSSKAMQEMCGVDQPIAGAFFTSDVLASPARVALSTFRHLGLEFELALTLKADAPARAAPYDAASARALVASARPAFELIEDKGADYAALDPLTLIADNAWCGGVVLGDEIEGWAALDLADLPAELDEGGVVTAANTGLADPLGSLAWVLNNAVDRGDPVRAGEVVITGSVLRTRFPAAGQEFTYRIAGAAVSVAFT